MRILIALSFMALAFAGCTAPVEPANPLFGVCPQWLDGATESHSLDAPGLHAFEAAHSMDHAGNSISLDRYHVIISDIATDGVIELRAFAESDGRVLRFTDVRDPAGARTPTFLALSSSSGTVAVDIFLSDVTHGAEAAPSNLRLEATGQNGAKGGMSVEVTAGYRVCGAPL